MRHHPCAFLDLMLLNSRNDVTPSVSIPTSITFSVVIITAFVAVSGLKCKTTAVTVPPAKNHDFKIGITGSSHSPHG